MSLHIKQRLRAILYAITYKTIIEKTIRLKKHAFMSRLVSLIGSRVQNHTLIETISERMRRN